MPRGRNEIEGLEALAPVRLASQDQKQEVIDFERADPVLAKQLYRSSLSFVVLANFMSCYCTTCSPNERTDPPMTH